MSGSRRTQARHVDHDIRKHVPQDQVDRWTSETRTPGSGRLVKREVGEGEGDRRWIGAGCRGAAEMGGPHHNAVECVRGILDLVDGFAIVRLEANLPAVRPGAFDSRILREGAENGVVARRQVFKDGILVADPVGVEISKLGEGILFVTEDDVAKKFGCKFEDDGAGGIVFFGRKGENIGDDQVGR
jgi:hypothetical protein